MLAVLLASLASSAVPAAAEVQARATIRVLKPAKVSEHLWKEDDRRKERIVTDEQGRRWRLRTIEFE